MNRPITFQNTAPCDMPSIIFDEAEELLAAERLDDLLRDEGSTVIYDYMDADVLSSLMHAMYQSLQLGNETGLTIFAKSLVSEYVRAGEKRLEGV